MSIQPRTVVLTIEVSATALSIKDIRDTARSVVENALDGTVRQCRVEVIQGTRKKAKKAARR